MHQSHKRDGSLIDRPLLVAPLGRFILGVAETLALKSAPKRFRNGKTLCTDYSTNAATGKCTFFQLCTDAEIDKELISLFLKNVSSLQGRHL